MNNIWDDYANGKPLSDDEEFFDAYEYENQRQIRCLVHETLFV